MEWTGGDNGIRWYAMNHHEIEQQDIIERYVRHELKGDERRAFQEHYFDCEQCFEQVQMTARFIAGVQRSSRVGVLADSAREVASAGVASWWTSWFTPAFALAATACLLLAVALGWIIFKQVPSGREEASKPKSTPEQLAGEKEQPTLRPGIPTASPAATEKGTEKSRREQLDDKLAQNQVPSPPPGKGITASVMLESSRDAKGGAQVKLPDNATALTLRMEVEVGRYPSYQLQLFAAGGRAIKTLSGLKANSQGALAVSVPAEQLPPGKYSVKLFGVKGQQKELVGDYDLTLRQ